MDALLSEQVESQSGYNGDEIQTKLQKAIITLPEKQRLVFNMRYYDEMKYEEMAKVLDTSVGALKASYHHAVKKIEKLIFTHHTYTQSNSITASRCSFHIPGFRSA